MRLRGPSTDGHRDSFGRLRRGRCTVDIGDTVWTNAGGLHNVKFDDGSFEQPADLQGNSWTVSRTFDSAGTYRYYCELHGDINGAGMSGTVTVNPASTEPPPVPIPSPVPPRGRAPRRRRRRRARRARRARYDRGGVISLLHEPDPLPRWTRPHGRERLRSRLSEPATVRIAFERLVTGRRRGAPVSRPSPRNRRAPLHPPARGRHPIRTDREAGDNTVAFSGRIGRLALRPGRRATISATDAAGNRSRTKDKVFRVLAAWASCGSEAGAGRDAAAAPQPLGGMFVLLRKTFSGS